ncbi:MAG: hypothetical protein WC907_05370 [Acholeplasmataceae bacterium]
MKKIKTKHGIIFNPLTKIFKLFKKKPKIYNLNEEETHDQGIIISNHSAASGPLTLSIYYPTFFVPWGTYEMTEKYTVRWKYLYHVFYTQKLGYNKFKSFILATLFGVISKMLYNGMQLIPTYPNLNFKHTIKLSINHLKKGNSILVFPEDSNTGYHEKLIKYNNGFVYLSEKYFKETKIDLPIYPVYYHKVLGSMIIGKKVYINDLKDKGLNRTEIADYFKDITNELAHELFKLERKRPIFKEEKVFKLRLINKLKNISGNYIELSVNDFDFLNNKETYLTYQEIMKKVMTKKDEIINEFKGRLKIRYYRR